MRRAALLLLLAGANAFAQAPAAPPRSDLERDFAASVKSFMEDYRAADEKSRPALLADPVREPAIDSLPSFSPKPTGERALRQRFLTGRGSPRTARSWT